MTEVTAPSNTELMITSKEMVSHTGKLLDQVQEALVKAYGLPINLAPYRPADYLWPDSTSKKAEDFARKQILTNDPRPGVILSDDGFIRGRLAKRGVLPYHQLKPVIFIPPETMDKLQGHKLVDLATLDNASLFSPVVEEVSHFLYQQTQYLHNNQLPGVLMCEGVAMLDWYLALKNLGNSSDEMIKKLWQTLTQKRGEIPVVERDFLDYKVAFKIMGGFVEQLMRDDQVGGFNEGELRDFYLLDGKGKMAYLLKLYRELSKLGLQFYYTRAVDVESYQLDSEFTR